MLISDFFHFGMILLEARQAPLYHWMSATKAARAFNSDRLRPLFAHKMLGKMKGISLTRNSRYKHDWVQDSIVIRLTLNQTKLAQRYKIVPVDAEHAAAIDRRDDPIDFKDRRDFTYRNGTEMAEEFLLGTIEPLHLYIDEIFLDEYHNDNTPLMNALPRYLRKWNNNFKTDDKWFYQNYMDKRLPEIVDD